ncbi:flagellar hook-length control protein FliK [Natranaerovirga pectinivora]|uniref:Flagellar hook-length control protein FliK n=1 Tax=Natranaerovirga pectinivora TaxID=682400 RepID=A0A4R3MN57_9FIRM|nr:flagellar hook-length control protein FliK [Natranaerovirga pectinivora]TCT16425.1 flagellar hook-length control protein FliK [Natranaerovirga pectinivora]
MEGFSIISTKVMSQETMNLKSPVKALGDNFSKIMDQYTKKSNKVEEASNNSVDNNFAEKKYQLSGKEIKPVEDTESLEKEEESIELKLIRIITEQLGITPEILMDYLSSMNLELKDLFTVDKLQDLTVEILEVSNILEILSDKELSQDIKLMFQEVRDLNHMVNDKEIEHLNTNIEKLPQETSKENYNFTNNFKDEESEKAHSGSTEKTNITIEVTEKDTIHKEVNSEVTSSFMEKFEQKLETFLQPHIETLDADTALDYEQIIKQIAEQIKVQIKPEITKMEFQLNPEHLGKINFSLISNQGSISARFVAQNQFVKEAIESQVVHLKESLDQQGIKVDKIEVVLSNEPFNQDKEKDSTQDNQKGSTKKNLKIQRINELMEEDLSEEVAIEEKNILEEESVINYTV